MTGSQHVSEIRVLDITDVNKGNLKAFVDVAIGFSMRVYGFRIIQQPGQKMWVSPPQRSWEGEDGKMKYSPILELTGSLKARVEKAILDAYIQTRGH